MRFEVENLEKDKNLRFIKGRVFQDEIRQDFNFREIL